MQSPQAVQSAQPLALAFVADRFATIGVDSWKVCQASWAHRQRLRTRLFGFQRLLEICRLIRGEPP